MAASIATRLSRYGAWAPMVLFSWDNTHNSYLPANFGFCNIYLWFSLLTIAVACLLGRRRGDPAASGAGSAGLRAADWAASVGMSASCVLLVSPALFGASPYLALAGSIAAGLGIGWSYVRWAVCLSHRKLRELIRLIFVGCIAWTVGRTVLYALPLGASTALAAAVPLLSGLMFARALRAQTSPSPHAGDAAEPSAHPHDASFSTWKLWAIVVALTLNNQLILSGTNPYAADLSFAYPIKAAFTVLLSCLVLVWTLKTQLAFDFVLLWRGLYTVAAFALLVISIGLEGPVLWIASSIAADLLIPILWLTICTVAHHTPIPSYLVVGVGLGAYGLASFFGKLAGSAAPAVLGLAPLCTVLLFMLFVVLALCLDSRNPDLLQLFDDLRGRQVRTADVAQINARCAAVGAEHRLTPREIEVMQMLCAGRSRGYVAETLYISENTVKTHADRLYKKLGVHSREELQTLAGV